MKRLIEEFFSRRYCPFVVLAIIGFLLYGQTLFFDFSYLDDNTLILDSQPFLASFENIFQAFTTDVFRLSNHSASYYRPVLTMSLMLDYQIGGEHPFIYHLTNIFLHLGAVSLLFVFLKKMGLKAESAFFGSLIFLTHPVITQAVAWVPGRNDSLAMIFILAAFIQFINHQTEKKKKFFAFHFLFLTLAFFTKETALFSLLLFVSYVCLIGRGQGLVEWKRYLAGWGGLVFVWIIMRQLALAGSAPMGLKEMILSVIHNFPAVVQLLGKVFLPFNLSVLPIIEDTTFIFGFIALGLLTLAIFMTKDKDWRRISFGAGWFMIFLLPSFIRPNPYIAADFIEHRLYIPLAGLLLIFFETVPLKKWRPDPIRLATSAILIFLFIFMTLRHSQNFKNRLTFWENAVENSPHYPLAHRNFGAMQYLDGNMAIAEKEFKEALKINPQEEMAHNNLGLIYAGQEKLAEAENEYLEELKVNPYYDNAHYNLALLYHKKGDLDKAREYMEKTLAINPTRSDAVYNLAILHYSQKNYQKAAIYANQLNRSGFPLPPELSALLEPLNYLQMSQ